MADRSSALGRCVGDTEAFTERYWATQPLLRPAGDPAGFDDLLSLSDVDHIVSSTSLRLPSFRLVKDGATLPSSRYTKTARQGSQPVAGMADPAAIFREFEEGATIVLQGLHRYWLPLARFCRELEIELGHPTQVNAYITPPGSRGLAVHRDDHDVFVLHVFGTKRWEVFGPTPELPPADPPLIEAELKGGDCLYIPRGFPHAAAAQESISAHLTVGILSPTWIQAVKEAVALAEEERAFGEPLPLGFAGDPETLSAAVEDRLREFSAWIEKVDSGEIADRLSRRFLTRRQSLLSGQLEQLRRLPYLSDDSVIRCRAGAMCVLRPDGEDLLVFLGDRELRMPAWVEPAIRALTDAVDVRVGELEAHLDRESRVVLVRRLVREGLLEVVG